MISELFCPIWAMGFSLKRRTRLCAMTKHKTRRGAQINQKILSLDKGIADIRSRLFFSRRHLWHSVHVVLFSRVWQTFSCSQRYILHGILVEQTLENMTTAYLGWDSFGDVVLKRTPVTSDKSGRMKLRRRAVPFCSDYREGAVISWGYGWGTPWPRGKPRGTAEGVGIPRP